MNVYQVVARSCENSWHDVERMALFPEVYTGPTEYASLHKRPFRVVYRHQNMLNKDDWWRFSCSGVLVRDRTRWAGKMIGENGSFEEALYWLRTGINP